MSKRLRLIKRTSFYIAALFASLGAFCERKLEWVKIGTTKISSCTSFLELFHHFMRKFSPTFANIHP